jgi:GNAT superfamily N-acetyltransferase
VRELNGKSRQENRSAKEVLRALQAKVAAYRKKWNDIKEQKAKEKGIRVINTLVANQECFPLKNRVRDQIIRKALKDKEASCQVAFYSLNNLIKGYVVYGKALKKEGMYIYYLAVHPDAQGHGVAIRLIEQVVEAALKQGINVISVTTVVKNPACALYEHLSEKIPGVTLRSKQEFTAQLGKTYDYIFDVKDRITAVAGESSLKQHSDTALAMLPGKAREFILGVAQDITHSANPQGGIRGRVSEKWAFWVVLWREAFREQLQLYRGWQTSGRKGYTWETFVNNHPPEDQDEIRKLQPRLDFSSKQKPLFWSSVRNHYNNNYRWLKFGQSKLAMTVAQKSDNRWEERTAALICGFLILAVMALYPLIIFKRLMNWACIFPRFLILSTVWINGLPGPASTGMPKIIGGVQPLKVLRRVAFFPAPRRAPRRSRMAKSALSEPSPIQRIGEKFLKEQQSTIIGGNGAGNVIPNAGPGAGTEVSLFANVKPLPVFEWPITRWWLHSIRVVYITVIKPVITLVRRQFMLWIKTSMGVPLGGKGFWTGFNNLVPPIITVYTCNISYETTTYAYIIIV